MKTNDITNRKASTMPEMREKQQLKSSSFIQKRRNRPFQTLPFLFVLTLCSLLWSCSSDKSELGTVTDKTASLKLTLEGSSEAKTAGVSAQTRASGSTLPTAEDNIKTLAVGVFNADGSVNTIAEPSISGSTISTINCTEGTCDVVVVANAPSGTFAGAATKEAFLARTVSLGVTALGGVQSSDNLPMSGQTTGVVLQPGVTTNASVTLSRLVARVSVSNIKTAFDAGGQYNNATFKTDKIFLYNASGVSKVATGDATTTMPTSPAWLNGGTVSAGTWTTGTDYLLDELSTPSASVTTPHWFYTFANNSTTNPTKLVISGLFDTDGSGTTYSEKRVYYPIVVNKAQTGTNIEGTGGGTSTIARNRDYAITATIKGIGADSPDEDIEPVSMQLSVSVDEWELTFLQDVIIY